MSKWTAMPFAAALLVAAGMSSPGPRAEPTGPSGAPDAAASSDREARSLPELIGRIAQSDYAGDRKALDRLFGEADRFLGDRDTESRVRYWKGFAKWRRAINGANETPAPTDLASDVVIAAGELRRSGELDSGFVDARIGEMQCLGLVLFFDRGRAGNDARIARLRELMGELKVTAAANPRYVWAWGMAYFTAPPEKGGGPDHVIPAYLKALEAMRGGAGRPGSPLDPSWGEAELCVNLAYSYLNRPSPDLALARKYVDEAIRLVPGWHYARDILRPQVEAAASAVPGR
ncbi:MAG: hypothetical protein HZB25_00830 [Candidatus Eisenbacteria bacterium]|nr:hypothetical protein [Candidatus Eisenbacteria bacterium]